MDERLGAAAQYHRKQLMQLGSKMRFLAAQIAGLLEDELWLRNARHANTMASLLAKGVLEIPGVRLAYPVEGNGVFAEVTRERAARLQQDWSFQVWSSGEDGRCVIRWMTAFDTTEADVEALVAAVRSSA
jgi:threonine aldolase